MKPANVTSPSEQVAPLPAAVAEIGKIHFEGNIIPHSWYQRITLESGKPDLPAIILLAEIIYWYRPYQTLDKRGKPLLRKHFDGDMFQCTAAYFVSKFGLTKDQTRKALKRLEDAGYIRREYRDIVQQGILRNCIMFVEPMPLAILAITHPAVATEATSQPAISPSPVGDPPSPVGDPPSPVGDPPSPVGDPPSPVGDLFKGIEITTEISTETTTTTTPNPSFSNARSTEPEPAWGSGGTQDEKPEGQDTRHGIAIVEPNEEKMVFQQATPSVLTTDRLSNTATEDQQTVFQEEQINGQQPELIYPNQLTTTEQQDIAAQLQPLPVEIAQQMLDVVESRIHSGQIRTNPAALLRGVIRKYQADPDAFDPSSGFQIAEARRRRVEAAARLEAAQQASIRQLQEVTPRRLSEIGRASLAAMLNTLRGG